MALACVLTLLGPTIQNTFSTHLQDTGQCTVDPHPPVVIESDALASFEAPGGHPIIADSNAGQLVEIQRFAAAQPLMSHMLRFGSNGTLYVLNNDDWRTPYRALSPDGSTLVLVEREASESTVIRVCDLATRTTRRAWMSNETTREVVFTPDGALMLVNEGRGKITLYDASNFRQIDQWDVREGAKWEITEELLLSPDGALAAFALGHDGGYEVRVWSVGSGQQRAILPGHSDELIDLAFSGDGSLLATYSMDGTVRLWGIPLP